MGRILDRILRRATVRRPRRAPLTARERYRHCSAAGAANDTFLERLAHLMATASDPGPVGFRAVLAGYETLSEAISTMVRALDALSGGRYPDLARRFDAIDRAIALDVLKERPIEHLPLVLWPDDPEAKRPDVVGGKAANLATVAARAQVAVPPWFAVTAHAYHHFLESSGLDARIDEMLGAADPANPAAMRAVTAIVRREILAAAVPADLERSLRDAYRRLAADGAFGVAVRSSAVAEDSAHSFAGQFESVLGVREEGLAEAYRRVVASKYRPEALRYAEVSGYLEREIAMPVLVMTMIQPRTSGVAHSRSPDRADAALVTAVEGLAAASLQGGVAPDRYRLSRASPHRLIDAVATERASHLRCRAGGGVVETPTRPASPVPGGPGGPAVRPAAAAGCLSAAAAAEVARAALRLEAALGRPVEVEWAEDADGAIVVVQSRALAAAGEEDAPEGGAPAPAGSVLLASGGTRVHGGVACGRVARVADPDGTDAVPPGSVLVVPTPSPQLTAVLPHVVAVVSDAGSPTGHMATVAREFGIPSVVGMTGASAALRDGALVTVDAASCRVWEGEVPELLARAVRAPPPVPRDPARSCLEALLERVAPLTLVDPESPGFVAANCATFHDIARFAHQRILAETFQVDDLAVPESRDTKRLVWDRPMEVLVLDIGGALALATGRDVRREDIVSPPVRALVDGMADPRLRGTGPVGFDLRGFVSVVVRSAADDRRYGEPCFMVCARDHVRFSARLAYHFAMVDAMCRETSNRNHVLFVFHGGGAATERREWRACFLADVLRASGFQVVTRGDRVEAVVTKREAGVILSSLVVLGRLMVSARQLDMVIDSRATACAFAAAFLRGDYTFETIRRE